MARKKLLECSFLIPLRRDPNMSDGEPHEAPAWNWLEKQLLVFGGATRDTGLKEGWYLDRDSGEPVTDVSRLYLVAAARKEVDRLRSILSEACVVFQQKCIYLSVAGHVEFVEGPTHEDNS